MVLKLRRFKVGGLLVDDVLGEIEHTELRLIKYASRSVSLHVGHFFEFLTAVPQTKIELGNGNLLQLIGDYALLNMRGRSRTLLFASDPRPAHRTQKQPRPPRTARKILRSRMLPIPLAYASNIQRTISASCSLMTMAKGVVVFGT